jgi:hypothetical protein
MGKEGKRTTRGERVVRDGKEQGLKEQTWKKQE